MKRVLFDANIYLNFYKTSDEVLGNIDRVIEVIKKENFVLILPNIIREEIEYNKYRGVVDFLDVIKDRSMNFSVPAFLKGNANVKKLYKKHKSFQEVGKMVASIGANKIENPKSHINQKISKLIDSSVLVHEKRSHINKAMFRFSRKYPPATPKKSGADRSIGDDVVWEMILSLFIDQDLIIVSNDGDYASVNNNKIIDEFLSYEWGKVSRKEIRLYTTLGEFINDYSKKKIPQAIINEERSASFNPLFASGISGASTGYSFIGSVDNGALVDSRTFGSVGLNSGILSADSFGYVLAKTKCPFCGIEYNFNQTHTCDTAFIK